MLRKLVPFRSWHLDWINAGEPGPRASDDIVALMERDNAWTGIVDGDAVFCAGTMAFWPTRHTSWAVLDAKRSPKYMRWITRMVRENLAGVRGRVEMTVRADFPAGQRWAEMLGFHVETPLLKSFGPEGEDHVGFVRLN